jgi:hypothetical protein
MRSTVTSAGGYVANTLGSWAEGIDADLIEAHSSHDGLLDGAGVDVCQPPEQAMIRAASAGPQVPGW